MLILAVGILALSIFGELTMYHDTIQWRMIGSFRDKRIAAVAVGKVPKGFPADLVRRTRAMLSAMDAAVVLDDLRFPPGNHLEKLAGDRAGQHSVRVNQQWRICFEWTETGPTNVELVDYH